MGEIEWKYAVPLGDDEEIQEVEEFVLLPLPADYKAFVRDHNGAMPRPNAIDLPNGREAVLNRLLRIESTAKGNVRSIAQAIWRERKVNLVPFAEDPFGNLYCFEYSGRNLKSVVFWDHESNTASRICATFSELIAALHQPGDA